MSQPVEPMTAVSLLSLAVLCVLGLRRLVLMEGLLELRAAVLTLLLWVGLFALFVIALPPFPGGCVFVIVE